MGLIILFIMYLLIFYVSVFGEVCFYVFGELLLLWLVELLGLLKFVGMLFGGDEFLLNMFFE